MRCRFFRCYFITLAQGSTGNHGIIKIFNSVYVKRSQLYYWTAVFLLLMMSLLSGHRGSVLFQSLQERYWVEHIHRHNTSLAHFTIVHKQNICHVHNNKCISADLEVHVSDKDTDLIRSSVTWIVSLGLLDGTHTLLSAWTAGCYISQFPPQCLVAMFLGLWFLFAC